MLAWTTCALIHQHRQLMSGPAKELSYVSTGHIRSDIATPTAFISAGDCRQRARIYTPKSNTRNRIPGTICTENAVSGVGVCSVSWQQSRPGGPRIEASLCTRVSDQESREWVHTWKQCVWGQVHSVQLGEGSGVRVRYHSRSSVSRGFLTPKLTVPSPKPFSCEGGREDRSEPNSLKHDPSS
eukprot:3249457-Rhodomonas_salina.4